jgi:hypothetical protein
MDDQQPQQPQPQQPAHQITPLRVGEMGLVTTAGVSAKAAQTIIDESRAWGMLGFDLEWSMVTGEITWIGLGHAGRAVSFWAPTLPNDAWAVIKAAIKDPTLPKLAHNIQAERLKWTEKFGEDAIGGLFEDTMLLHHAACPGLAHDLQQVTSQFLVVPPWKTWHRQANKAAEAAAKEQQKAVVAETKAEVRAQVEQTREAAKAEKTRAKLQAQCEKFLATYPESVQVADYLAQISASEDLQVLEIDIKTAISLERERIKEERKDAKQAAHDARIEQQRIEKEAKKAAKQAAHEARNAKSAADAAATKSAAKLFARPTPTPEHVNEIKTLIATAKDDD